MTRSDFDFDDLVGEELDFYGVDGQRFRLDEVTYEVFEGVRSFHIEISDKPIEGLPIARVYVDNGAFNDDSFELIDLHDDHTWLSFGTHYKFLVRGEDEFYFDYTPKDIHDEQ